MLLTYNLLLLFLKLKFYQSFCSILPTKKTILTCNRNYIARPAYPLAKIKDIVRIYVNVFWKIFLGEKGMCGSVHAHKSRNGSQNIFEQSERKGEAHYHVHILIC